MLARMKRRRVSRIGKRDAGFEAHAAAVAYTRACDATIRVVGRVADVNCCVVNGYTMAFEQIP